MLAAFCAGLLPSGHVLGQRLPDAGQLQQDIDRRARELDRAADAPRRTAPDGTVPPGRPVSRTGETGPTVTLRQIEFSGARRLSEGELQKVVQGYLGRPLQFPDLQRAAADVANRYREAGWIVRTSLPPQDIGDGVLRIEIIEARFGAVRIEHDDAGGPIRVERDRIRARVLSSLVPGEALSAVELDRTLRLLDEVPGVKIKGRLAAGQEDSQSDLVLQTVNAPAVSGSLGVDNQGARSTGSTRVTAAVSWSSPAGWGERWSAQTLFTDGNRYLRAQVQLPWSHRGATVGLSGSTLSYRLTDPALAALAAEGTSRTAALDAAYPLVRTVQSTLSLNATAETRLLVNRALGAVTSDYRIDSLQVGASGYGADSWGGGGVTSLGLTGTWGRAVLDGSPHEASDAQGPRIAGSFTKLRVSLTRQQALSDQWTLTASLNGQWTERNLDSSERFQLGGVSGVRAYAGSEASGRSGHLMSLELSRMMRPGLSVSAFADRGEVVGDRSVGTWQATGLRRTMLQGAGLGSSISLASGLSARVMAARRIGVNPNPTAAGLDQDGTLTVNRWWLELGGQL